MMQLLPYIVNKFAGNTSQWGGGILQTIARFAFPILRRLAGVAANTAEDVIYDRKPFTQSLVDNTMNEIQHRPKQRVSINTKRKRLHMKDNLS